MDKKVSAFIAMKGHSERVSNKNITIVERKPLFYYIIDTLIKSKYVDDIIIDTDSEEIMELVKKTFPSVFVHMRSENLLIDRSEIINMLISDNIQHMKHEHILQTHSTNPLITTETINKSIEKYFENLEMHDSTFSVTPIKSRFFYQNGKPINHDPSFMIRTQDMDPIYEENSCIYLISKSTFSKVGKRIGNTPIMFPIDPVEATDIDEQIDLDYVKFIMSNRKNNEK